MSVVFDVDDVFVDGIGKCCFCKEECDWQSQACDWCVHNGAMHENYFAEMAVEPAPPTPQATAAVTTPVARKRKK